MTDTAEKSCWGITVWAVAIVVGIVVLTTLFSSADTATAIVSAAN